MMLVFHLKCVCPGSQLYDLKDINHCLLTSNLAEFNYNTNTGSVLMDMYVSFLEIHTSTDIGVNFLMVEGSSWAADTQMSKN